MLEPGVRQERIGSRFAALPGARAEQDLLADVFERFPYGIMVCERGGRIVAANRPVQQIIDRGGLADGLIASCCSLLRCGRPGGPPSTACLTELALRARAQLPEIRVDVPAAPTHALWVTAAPLDDEGSRVVFQVRPASPGDRRAVTSVHGLGRQPLRIFALGRLRVEAREASLSGDWVDQRAGQLLRLLVCERERTVPTEVIAESIWPRAGPTTPNTVRHFVHALRERLEPGRAKHAESSFIVSRRGGYALQRESVWIDADEFEEEARLGTAALAAGEPRSARDHLVRAAELYKDDFLSDQPYAEWAFLERERLRAVAAGALRGLGTVLEGEPAAATPYLERLAEMEPFDNDAQRELISVLLRLGRRSRAARHYQSFRLRLLREFGERPDFELADLVAA
jgi:DNA-binding SARP family transcriptional activator